MTRKAKLTINWLTGSDLGIALLVVNVILMGWVGLLTDRPFPTGFDVVVGIIFTGKTFHSVASKMKEANDRADNNNEDQHG